MKNNFDVIVYIFTNKWDDSGFTYRYCRSIEDLKYEYKKICYDTDNFPPKYPHKVLYKEDYQPFLKEMYDNN